MSHNVGKLQQDVTILAAMAAEMDVYLDSEVLFWPMAALSVPRLTLGGYLMRQHRLLALKGLLSAEEQVRVDETVAAFNTAVSERIVRLEKHAHQEIDARLRQWRAYLDDLQKEYHLNVSNYATAVESRVMLEALTDYLQRPPHQLNTAVLPRIGQIDAYLQARWEPGAFGWDEQWQPAYPVETYWWLYGRPKGAAVS
ncbi:MAG: hypothetical protein Kow0080_30640 [Candidatus Promineifilaceae bacterium]